MFRVRRGGARVAPPVAKPATSVKLPAGARPLYDTDSLSSVKADSSTSSNLSAAQLAALNRISARMTAVHGVDRNGSTAQSRSAKNITTTSPYEHANLGSEFPYGNYNGVYSTQSWASVAVAPGTQQMGFNPQGGATSNIAYADTTKGPGNNCFESGSGYWAAMPNQPSSSQLSAFYVFDFCRNPIQFVVVKPFGTSDWYQYSRFVTNPDGTYDNLYTIENFKASDGNWHAMLYNYRTSTWEDLAVENGALQSGSSPGNPGGEGWSFTEYYNEPNQPLGSPGYCQNIGYDSYFQLQEPVQATAYLLAPGSGTLVPVDSTNANFLSVSTDPSGLPQCWSIVQDGSYPSYQFQYIGSASTFTPASEWTVVTHPF